MAYSSKTVTMSNRKFVNRAQAIQRRYYNEVRNFLATASDEQVEQFKTAIGQADTLGVFAAEQEQEARKEGMLDFTKFEKPAEVTVTPEFMEEFGTESALNQQ